MNLFEQMKATTPVTTNLIIINCIVFLATVVLGGIGLDLDRLLGLHYYDAPSFHSWQLLTYMFMHGGFSHLFFNMFSLFMFGRIVEQTWGMQRFIVYYAVCGFGAAIVQQLAWRFGIVDDILSQVRLQDPSVTYGQLVYEGGMLLDRMVTVGASGSIFGLLLAFGMLFPNELIYFYFVIPIKAKYFVVGYGILELFAGVAPQAGSNVAHFAHLGGMLFGLLLILWWRHNNKLHRKRYGNNFYVDY